MSETSAATRPTGAARVISPRTPEQAEAAAEQQLLRDLEQAASAPSARPPLRALGLLGGHEGEFVVDLGAPLCGKDVRTARDVLKRADAYGVSVRDLTVCGEPATEETKSAVRPLRPGVAGKWAGRASCS
ncbi:hypothetical protein ACFU9Y_27745 [Streptomyces sp. NPDC057621]|uniref:hypothetical protein n=1 Tax=Streptomyces sp. NPDC057621 TaxID=3346186 RepID=UPI0036B653C3